MSAALAENTYPTDLQAPAAARLRLVLVRLARLMRQRAGVTDLTATLLAALGTVEARGPITLGDLAAAEGVQPPTMTRVVAKLEAHGLVQRHIDAADRRVSRVQATSAGIDVVRTSRTRRDAFLAEQLALLTPQERAALEAALPVLERLAVPPGPPEPPVPPGPTVPPAPPVRSAVGSDGAAEGTARASASKGRRA